MKKHMKWTRLLGVLFLTTGLTMTTDGAEKTDRGLEKATLGGGCFWCVEAIYKMIEGVEEVTSGFAGGHVKNPSYKEVITGRTGHAEVIQVEFDPKVISYESIIDLFWDAHDPTTLNRQGNDVGPQYRSIILFHNEDQERIARASMKAAASRFADPIVTEIVPLERFYVAEGYHQDYYELNPNQGYCRYVISPKIAKFQKKHKDTLKD